MIIDPNRLGISFLKIFFLEFLALGILGVLFAVVDSFKAN
jgi:hypothetical protein